VVNKPPEVQPVNIQQPFSPFIPSPIDNNENKEAPTFSFLEPTTYTPPPQEELIYTDEKNTSKNDFDTFDPYSGTQTDNI